jgi:dTDP-4-dehydrorhamnose 3,5-epimerase
MTDLERPPSSIDGVRFGAVPRFADGRGALREAWRASAYDPDTVFVQANLSTSMAGVLRGLHVHQRQLDRWLVVDGRAVVALVDIRPLLVADAARDAGAAASARPVVETRELVADEWADIPAGVAHGFLAPTAMTLLYLVTNEYDGTDEHGFSWDDPDAAVPWPALPGTPDGRPVLSDRDRSNPSLRDLVGRLRAGF